MTRVLNSSPLTEEDINIWVAVLHSAEQSLMDIESLLRPFFRSDRRDARIFRRARQQREWLVLKNANLPPWLLPFSLNDNPIGGDITTLMEFI